MLIYSKKTDSGVKLYGTLLDIPSDDDAELVYKNAETGETVEISEGGMYVTFSKDGVAHVCRVADSGENTDLSVFIGETLVIGPEVAATESAGEETSEETVAETVSEESASIAEEEAAE